MGPVKMGAEFFDQLNNPQEGRQYPIRESKRFLLDPSDCRT